MNNLGAVKIGLAVAAAGAMGALKFFPHTAARQTAGMISGASESMGGGGFDQAFASKGLAAARGYAPAAAPSSAPEPKAGPAVRKIVRTASVIFEVQDQGKARSLVHAAALRHGAEIDSDSSSGEGGDQTGVIVLKAPPEQLDALLKELEPVGRTLERSLSSENMSEEYVDLQARLSNARKVEKRLTELLSFNTRKLGDVLQVERELERVGRDIEQTLGRMKYIDSLAARSCVTVTLRQPHAEQSQAPGIAANIRNSAVNAFNTFISTGLSLLTMTGFLLAVGLWTVPAGAAVWYLKRKIWG